MWFPVVRCRETHCVTIYQAMLLGIFIEYISKLESYDKMHCEKFYGFKISVNVCLCDVRECINGLNGMNGLGPEPSLHGLNFLNELGP